MAPSSVRGPAVLTSTMEQVNTAVETGRIQQNAAVKIARAELL